MGWCAYWLRPALALALGLSLGGCGEDRESGSDAAGAAGGGAANDGAPTLGDAGGDQGRSAAGDARDGSSGSSSSTDDGATPGAAGAAGAAGEGDDPGAGAPGSTDAASNADAGPGDDGPPDTTPPDATGTGVTLEGAQLRVDGSPFRIQGVCWNPVGRGGTHPADLDFAGFAAGDAELMRQAGINAVRTYAPITDSAVLDTLHAAGIHVLNMVYAYGGDDVSAVDARVEAVKDHPAILMWVLGNEWNYNGLYVGMSHDASRDALNAAASRILAIDDSHPIATVYGEVPSAELVAAMPDVDVWGINAYRGLSFGGLFEQLAAVTDKPVFLAEYGADAYDANQDAVNLGAQADATRALTEEIMAHGPGASPGGRCLGGTLFEWADEWWKDGAGSPDAQDVGGIAPGGGPHPDQTFNEEWWGVVDIERKPRPAYDALKALYLGP